MKSASLRLILFLALIFSPALLYSQNFDLTILHNNDGESKLIGSGSGVLNDFGGVARFKSLSDTLKAEASNNSRSVIMLSSGDNFLAGPEFYVSQQLPSNEYFYDSQALDRIGYDAMAIGNHEFDFGPDVLARFIKGFENSQTPFISANLDFSMEDSLDALADEGRILPYKILNIDGEQVGIIGATTPMLRAISSPRDVVIDTNIVDVVQNYVDTLTNLGVNKIILISHLQSIKEDSVLATQTTGIDIMIAGGGDEVLANAGALLAPGDTSIVYGSYPFVVNNNANQPVYLVTTGGDYKYIGKLEVEFNSSGEVTSVLSSSGPVRVVGGSYPDSVSKNQAIVDDIIAPLESALSGLAGNVIGTSQVPLDGVRNNVRTKETNLGNVIADALLWQAQQLAGSFNVPSPQVAFQNGGGIRNNSVIPAGNITELNTFSIVPFANFVSVIPDISASQIKEILENAVSRIEFVDGRFSQIAGFEYTYNASGQAQIVNDEGTVLTPGSRIFDVKLTDGTYLVKNGSVVDGAPSVSVASIDFLARGGDQYPFRGADFTTLGLTYQQALGNYIESGLGGTISSADYPEGGEGRIVSKNYVTIAEAREDLNADGIPDNLNDTLTVVGVVISPNYQTSNHSYNIWDGTGGLTTFLGGTTTPTLNLGDRVEMTGIMGQFRGLTQIQPFTVSDINILNTGEVLPDPMVLTLAEYKSDPEAYEGKLIAFASLNKVSGTWPSAGGSATLVFTDGIDSMDVRIDSDTDIDNNPEPVWPKDIIGLGSQFSSGTTIYFDGYQILPRFYSDFLDANTVPVELASFNAGVENGVVSLIWSTATETNNKGFEIERKSSLNEVYSVIGFVEGKGTTVEPASYSFKHTVLGNGRYTYRLKQIDFSGEYNYSQEIEIEISSIPSQFSLEQNYPNPFNPSTSIRFSVPEESKVVLKLYNSLGEEIRTIINEVYTAGSHEVIANIGNLPSGLYLYKIEAGSFSEIRKMMLLK